MKKLVLVFLLGLGIGYLYAIPKPQPPPTYKVWTVKGLVVWPFPDGVIVKNSDDFYAIKHNGKTLFLGSVNIVRTGYSEEIPEWRVTFEWTRDGEIRRRSHVVHMVEYFFK